MPKRKAASVKAAAAKKAKAAPPPVTSTAAAAKPAAKRGRKAATNDEAEEVTPTVTATAAAAKPAAKRGKKAATNDEAEEVSPTVTATAAAAKPAAKRGKKAASSDDVEEVTPAAPQSAARQLVEALKKAGGSKKKTHTVDSYCTRLSGRGKVLDDYDCMLNQTNIGHNNNKYYVIQVIELDGHYYTWTRWGRVGEPGANAIKGPTTQENAVKEFTKKFYDKTRNKWESRDSFQTVAGQYTLLDMGDDDEDGGEDTTDSSPQVATTVKESDCLPSSLDKPTQDLVKLIFDNNMFQDALKDLEIDTKKMPLGKLSKTQIAKGFEALEQIEQALEKNEKSKLAELSSQFYTVIPHDFGRKLPPTINSMELLRKKMDMLMVLADIELAQSMQKGPDKDVQQEKCAKPRHPLDRQYDLLQCRLSLLDKTSDTYKILEKYMRATQCEYRKPLEIISIWEMERNSEAERFAVNSSIENRKLLWHGTNVAVVAAILKSGLRIMPHSGGRVGRGIYFASENGKSAGYVRSAQGGIGIMFLSEVALGKEHHITQDNSSLKMAPKGFDSIIAKGRTEPDPKLDAKIELDGHTVIVPQGPPIRQDKFSNSSFSQSEYLIYREDQCRLRYILELKFAY